MKKPVNYVIPNEKEHRHESDIIDTISSPCTFSPEQPRSELTKRAKSRQKELTENQK